MVSVKIYFTVVIILFAIVIISGRLMNSFVFDNEKRSDFWYKVFKINCGLLLAILFSGFLYQIWFLN